MSIAAKKRILFVDDDALLLRVYEMMLEDEPYAWDIVTANDAATALDLIKNSEFDIVVSDMRMPGMSGTELMKEVRNRHPRTSRVILSGMQDQKEIAESLQATHQFVPKPFHPRELKLTLEQICGLNVFMLDDRLQSLVGVLDNVPSFPSVYLEVMAALGSEDPSIEHVAEIIARDPALIAKILQVANSAAFGLMNKVSSPFEAVQFLGFSTIRSMTLSIHVFANFSSLKHRSFSVERLCDHSMHTGVIARSILQAEHAAPAAADDAYTGGMLHDMGKLMLAQNLPEDFDRALQLAEDKNIPLHDAEVEVFGATHAGVGAYLLGLWGLPASIVEAVAFHHTPEKSSVRAFGPPAAVHVASAIEHEITGDGEAEIFINSDYLTAIGKGNQLPVWRADAEELLTASFDS